MEQRFNYKGMLIAARCSVCLQLLMGIIIIAVITL